MEKDKREIDREQIIDYSKALKDWVLETHTLDILANHWR
jgi:hypothetical protein